MTDDYEYDDELELLGALIVMPSYSRHFEIKTSTVNVYNYSIMNPSD